MIIEVRDSTLNELAQKQNFFVVDCFATWCPPCRMLEPIFEELAKEFSGKITFGRLNVDENRAAAAHFKITGVPTLLIFKGGKHVESIVGLQPKEKLTGFFRRLITS